MGSAQSLDDSKKGSGSRQLGSGQSVDDSKKGRGTQEGKDDAAETSGKNVRRSQTCRLSVRKPRGKKTRLGEILPQVGMRNSHVEDILTGVQNGLEAGKQIPALARLDTLLDELLEVEEKREELKKVPEIDVVQAKQNGTFAGLWEQVKGIFKNATAPETSFNLSMDAWEFSKLTTRKNELEVELEALTKEISSTYESPAEIYTRNFQALEGDAYFTTMVAVDLLIFWLYQRRLGEAAGTCVLQVLVFVLCLAFQGIIIVYLSIATLAMYQNPCNIKSHLALRVIGVAIFVGEMFSEFVEVTQLYAANAGARTDFAKWISRSFVIRPKVVIAICLLVVGSCFVCLSEDDTELILNCLAMNFVVKIDEMVQGILTKGQHNLYWPEQLFVASLRRNKSGTRSGIQKCYASSYCVVIKGVVWASVVTAFIVLLPPFSGVLATNSGVFIKPHWRTF